MIYLASGSPRRRRLLETLSVPFEVNPVDADERPPEGVPAELVPVMISKRKATLASEQLDDGVILSADTVVVDGNEIMGKPADREEAIQVLLQLRGREHQVITGVTAQKAGSSSVESITCVSQVILRDLDQEEIESYVSTGKPLDRAGGYGLQDRTADPVRAVKGCRTNVLGLPICLLSDLFEPFDVSLSGAKGTGCKPDQNDECQFELNEFIE